MSLGSSVSAVTRLRSERPRYHGSIPGTCIKMTDTFHLLSRLRMCGALPSLVRIPSWHAQIQNKIFGTPRSGLEPGPFVTPPFPGFSELYNRTLSCFLLQNEAVGLGSIFRVANSAYYHSEQCFPHFFARGPFWIRKITKNTHILAHVNRVSG